MYIYIVYTLCICLPASPSSRLELDVYIHHNKKELQNWQGSGYKSPLSRKDLATHMICLPFGSWQSVCHFHLLGPPIWWSKKPCSNDLGKDLDRLSTASEGARHSKRPAASSATAAITSFKRLSKSRPRRGWVANFFGSQPGIIMIKVGILNNIKC